MKIPRERYRASSRRDFLMRAKDLFRLSIGLLMALAMAPIPVVAQVSPTGNYALEAQDFGVPPQQTLHLGEPHAPTPLSAPGTKTITTAELYERLAARQPMTLLYVNEAQDGLAIAGSHWLYGAGRGQTFDDAVQKRLAQKVGQLSAGNTEAPIVVFCFDPHCWLSYNVALRLAKAGYRNVSWYRGGREAWKAAGLLLTRLDQEAW
jgi:PQQ-dependent catabolism-associated CXXCW motif protein